ncbi:iron-containing redox enzyme family protein [Nonomuraea sp. SMC257]|uniref:Iron-containing redox enzyme family protein n=1 Tax=Nonomuraea montanisoli TaxID=2741721 RepID=A0A7Y6M120_9ACTN|nr:iron-containing redox enzyme family protein [Nonomuraea montanisoli]NUW31128.1 iron-containing redox enzyme family protein [Nonomuraea montanisoli]
MRLPRPRGPVTAALFARLAAAPSLDPPTGEHPFTGPFLGSWAGDAFAASSAPEGGSARVACELGDADLQLALFTCYELHYQGFDGVDPRWEWEPSLLAFRAVLERRFERALARAVPRPPDVPPGGVRAALAELTAPGGGPSMAAFLRRQADLGQFREFVAHRSVYHLKEADPHTWAIPRLRGGPKAALVEIQSDEYGGGRTERMHAELFRVTMRGLGLDDSYGAYLDRVPGVTLAVSNVMSLFGLHRRLRGAAAGHLAALEMTSSLPNRQYAEGLRRLGGDAATARFFDEHVQADAVHEQIAAHDLCAGLAAQDPSLAGDILYGAACALEVERLWSEHVLGCWRRGASSLEPLEACADSAGTAGAKSAGTAGAESAVASTA